MTEDYPHALEWALGQTDTPNPGRAVLRQLAAMAKGEHAPWTVTVPIRTLRQLTGLDRFSLRLGLAQLSDLGALQIHPVAGGQIRIRLNP